MTKRKKSVKGALLAIFVVVVAFGAIFTIRSFNTAGVSKSEKSENSKTNSCKNIAELQQYFKPSSDFDLANHKLTIFITNGKFKVTDVTVEMENPDGSTYKAPVTALFQSDPTGTAILSDDSPLVISTVPDVNARVTIHFVLIEDEHGCLNYDQADSDEQGNKLGTYEFDAISEINSKTTSSIYNENYNGVCAVFRTGNGYNKYSTVFNDAGVTAEEIQKYNASAVGEEGYNKYYSVLPYCFNEYVGYNYDEDFTAQMIKTAITIWKRESTQTDLNNNTDFMKEFNRVKEEAIKRGNDYSNLVKNGSLDDTRFGETCKWDLKTEKDENGKVVDYYVNKNYYYASETTTTPVKENYKYEWSSGEVTTVSPGKCVRTCEESTLVEYGPPVASKAGLCFEYKIRVTSRVVCNAEADVTPPDQPPVHTPVPYCNDFPSYTNDAGPSEDYDACILACDGGKYSKSCSNKCYKEVYGEEDDNSNSISLALSYENAVVQPMANNNVCGPISYSGKYVWSEQAGRVLWKSNGNSPWGTYGRWYGENKPSVVEATHGITYCVFANVNVHWQEGFRRSFKGNGWGICQQDCRWLYNSKKEYWNAEDAQEDAKRNMQIYNQAQASCEGAASCTTKTAKFTISVDYTDTENKEHTIEFPYSSSKVDQATLPSHGSNDTKSPSGTEIFIPELTINPDSPEAEDGYAGCYDSSEARNWYQVAWSFPGTWINNKTGEISYVDKGNDTAWHKQEGKFCVPLNAKSVNTGWWEWSQLGSQCYTGNGKDIDYNIHGAATDFGYFGWNFDFECFYALRNEVCTPDGNGCCEETVDDPCTGDDCDTTLSTEDYTFRIVDLVDLFPKGEKKTENNSSSISYTGRQPGYNWTLGYSDNGTDMGGYVDLEELNNKANGYKISNPLEYIKQVQDLGKSVYSDEYLDYQITLESEDLRNIRDYNKKYEYTDYQGKTEVKNGVTSYWSNVLTDLQQKGKFTNGTSKKRNDGYGVNRRKGA